MRVLSILSLVAASVALAACQTPSTSYEVAGRADAAVANDASAAAKVVPHRNPWDYPDFQLNKS